MHILGDTYIILSYQSYETRSNNLYTNYLFSFNIWYSWAIAQDR